MKTSLLLATLLLTPTLLTPTLAIADDKTELIALLGEFLDGATRNDPAIHNKYWADELIYTSSNGTRFGKAELMQSVNSRGELKPNEIGMRYSSEDVQILQYGDTAVVAFTLVGKSDTETLRFFNSGTFIRKNGNWQAVNWQATKKQSRDETLFIDLPYRALLLIRCDSADIPTAFAKAEPHAVNGLMKSWHTVVGEGAANPVIT